ncbi:MAG TPA: hypothetical protein PLK38_07930 [Methanoregulaceae archaeon]|nr:hypothetical protein [Methanoregulaceae archaeon]
MTDAQVAIPWRPTPDRIPAFKRCTKYWRDHGFPVITADSDPSRPFLCNAGRNNAIAQVTTDVIISADGDTIPEDITQICQAVEIVAEHPDTVVWPFTTYCYLFAWEVGHHDLSTARVVHALDGMSAGIVVFSRATFADLGGYDEGFVPGAWGGDDRAFHLAAETLHPFCRLPGRVYSFDHSVSSVTRAGGISSGRTMDEENPNYARLQRYESAAGDPVAMRELISERV